MILSKSNPYWKPTHFYSFNVSAEYELAVDLVQHGA